MVCVSGRFEVWVRRQNCEWICFLDFKKKGHFRMLHYYRHSVKTPGIYDTADIQKDRVNRAVSIGMCECSIGRLVEAREL